MARWWDCVFTQKQICWLALRHQPIRLENVNDADVDQQSLSFRIARWDTAHAGRTGPEETTTTHQLIMMTQQKKKTQKNLLTSSSAHHKTHWSSESSTPFPRASPWMDSIAVQYRLFWACGRRWSGVTAPSDPPLSPELPPPRSRSRQAWSMLWMPSNRL